MKVKDYNNLIAVLVGIAIILICILVYYLSQLYFNNCENQSKKIDNKNNKPEP